MPAPSSGLREAKKAQTRHALHRAALELALEQGPDGVTVEAIAARAEVSPRTFFNYFPSRESAMSVSDPGIAERLAAMLLARPADEPLLDALRAVLTERVRELAADAEEWRLRRRLAREHPSLALASVELKQGLVRALVAAALEREGQDEQTGPRDRGARQHRRRRRGGRTVAAPRVRLPGRRAGTARRGVRRPRSSAWCAWRRRRGGAPLAPRPGCRGPCRLSSSSAAPPRWS